ncbi:MAG: NlpC/P60 family protein [Propionibacteriaceae bacterium]|nr:NlpC/P60 family protein [Propionibacteriaceae bacterium]
MLIERSKLMSRRSLLGTTALSIPALGLAGAMNLFGATPARAATREEFVSMAETCQGCAYVFGTEGPTTFDCSGLIKWSLAQVGVGFPRTSGSQIEACNRISVDEALGIRGALLHYSGHIAISRGDGTTMEARSPSQGVNIFSAAGMGWTSGGLIPALGDGGGAAPAPPAGPDGYWGSDTTKHLQAVLGTPQDGVVSSQDVYWKGQNSALTSGWEWSAAATGSTVIRAMQDRLGVTADGLIGPNTIKALQRHLGTPEDGTLTGPSLAVQELQKRVYAGQF